MSEITKRLQVTCSCCGATLTVDAETGLVLSGKEHKRDYSLDDALKREQEKKQKADELFAKAFQDEERRHSSLEEKFRKALDSKEELDDPKRPFDFD